MLFPSSNTISPEAELSNSAELQTELNTPKGGFSDNSDDKESACSAGDLGSFPGSGSSPAEENGYPLQYSCLENSMDRGAWWARVHGVAKGQTQLSN